MPIVVHRYYNTGLFTAMTIRGLFDIGNKDDSRPVSQKTFLPEAFVNVDLGSFSILRYPRWLQWFGDIFPPDRDRNVFQWGLQHESNGGKGAESRGILFRHYVNYTYKWLPVQPGDSREGVFSDQYKHRFSVRMFKLFGIEDNKDIKHYIGFMDLQWDWQFSPFRRGIWGLSCWLNPSFSNDDWSNFDHTSFSIIGNYTPPWNLEYQRYKGPNPFKLVKNNLHIPLSFYIRYWNGHNDFLLKYWERSITQGVGVGILLRN